MNDQTTPVNNKKLYIGNLSYDTTEDSLRDAFGQFGEIVDVKLIVDKFSGRSKGFAFVEFMDDDAAQKAIDAMNGKDLDGRQITVNVARPMAPRPAFGGGDRGPRRGGSGFGGGSQGGYRGNDSRGGDRGGYQKKQW